MSDADLADPGMVPERLALLLAVGKKRIDRASGLVILGVVEDAVDGKAPIPRFALGECQRGCRRHRRARFPAPMPTRLVPSDRPTPFTGLDCRIDSADTIVPVRRGMHPHDNVQVCCPPGSSRMPFPTKLSGARLRGPGQHNTAGTKSCRNTRAWHQCWGRRAVQLIQSTAAASTSAARNAAAVFS
jgi:hypothetical protein